jgi:tRNA uridine 5-carboxymethylaminomethyl modification enzyme
MIDVLVVGGGHAGIEAANICWKLNLNVVLVTLKINRIGFMPCNPSLGGPAKGIVVREIDVLGGLMGYIGDQCALQTKLLNASKGPGVQCLRQQTDKVKYANTMQEYLKTRIKIIEDEVLDLIVEDNTCKGVVLKNNGILYSNTTVLTTGTYMDARTFRGNVSKAEGPDGEAFSTELSKHLKTYGFIIQRLKTGTPPRVLKSSIDYTNIQEEYGTPGNLAFSYLTTKYTPFNEQEKCWLIHTNDKLHSLIRDNLSQSAMYGGYIKGVGPRYCPSIEDKIVRFSDKPRHQLFLEPESLSLDTIYLQGFSTSMPVEIQDLMVGSLDGFANAKIVKYAYAIEYDCLDPLQLQPSLETKVLKNLFTAGQINGTSGYEEAAGQGIIAGINAALKVNRKDPLILKRSESYIGVLIDDLVTKGTNEPYRLLTSRSEYRLYLRHDNADQRLIQYAYDLKTIDETIYQRYRVKKELEQELILKLQKSSVKVDINALLSIDLHISETLNAYDILKRPFININTLCTYLGFDYSEEVMQSVEIQVKYQGYLKNQELMIQRFLLNENTLLPKDIDYSLVTHISLEAKAKLQLIHPLSVGQASRISGINTTDIQALLIYLKGRK